MRVLEIGSQSWEWSLFRYNYRPRQLTCINISEAELEIGRMHAKKLGVSCDFRRMDAHGLEFADGSLDFVFGVAILHHLEFPRALGEIHRVLRCGGKIVLVEPLRHNPVARLVRWMTPQWVERHEIGWVVIDPSPKSLSWTHNGQLWQIARSDRNG